MIGQHEQDIIDKLRALGEIEPDRAATEAAIARVRRRLNSTTPGRAKHSVPLRAWRRAIVLFALAASVAAAIVLPTVRRPGSFAFGDAVRAFESLEHIRYVTENVRGTRTTTSQTMILKRRLRRTDHQDGHVDIFDRQRGELLTLYPEERRALRRIDVVVLPDMFEWIDQVRNQALIDRHTEVADDGRHLTVFQFRNDRSTTRVWIDSATKLPFRWESTSRDADGGEVRTIHRDFSYGEHLNQSLFSLTVPAGYEETTEGIRLQPLLDDLSLQSPVISGAGIGPARYGMSAAEVLQAFGQPDEIDETTQLYRYASRGIDLFIHPQLGLYGAICRTQGVYPRRLRDFSGQTDRGVQMGSSEEEILQAYGEPAERAGSPGNRTLKYNNPSIAFSLHDNKVVFIQTNSDY